MSFGQFLTSGTFIEGLAVNWQAAIMQLASLIVFSSFLYQRGAPHSRDPEKDGEKKKKKRRRHEGFAGWFWRHSLELAFAALFLTTLTVHIVFGCAAENERLALLQAPPLTLGDSSLPSAAR